MNNLNDTIIWALSKRAKEELADLEKQGFSRDLAFALLETLVPENALYSIDEDEDE